MTAPGRPAATEGRMSGDAEFGAMFNAAIRRRRPPEPGPEPEGYVHPGPADAGGRVGSPGPRPSCGAQLNAALREPRQRPGRLEVW
jgi:hypothetical protein